MGPSQFHRYPFRSSDTTDPMFVCRPSPISLALLIILFPNRSIIFWQSSPPHGRIGQFRGQFIFRSSERIIFHGGFSSIMALASFVLQPTLSFLLHFSLGSPAIIYQSIGTLTCICRGRDVGNRSFFSLFNLVVPRFVRFILEPALL